MTLGDRSIVIMKDGYIQQIGTPQEVFDQSRHIFVAGFIGMPQMVLLPDAKLGENGGDSYVIHCQGASFVPGAQQNSWRV